MAHASRPAACRSRHGPRGGMAGRDPEKRQEVRELCGLSNDMELMAVVALGHPAGRAEGRTGNAVEEVLLKEL